MASEIKVICRLHKITIAYVPHEDRVCFRGQSVAGEFIWLWITRGLLRNLIPRLADCALALETSESSDLYSAASLKPSVYDQSPDPVPEFAPSRREILVHNVRIQQASDGATLFFCGPSVSNEVSVTLSAIDLGIVLQGLNNFFHQAGWDKASHRAPKNPAGAESAVSKTIH